MTETQEQMFKKNMKLVPYVAVKWFGVLQSNPNYDDCTQEGFIGLMKACETFDEGRNCSFTTYATACIRNEILSYFYRSNRESFPYMKIYRKWCEASDQGMKIEEFCEITGISQYKVSQAIAVMTPIELDKEVLESDEDYTSFGDTIGDTIADPSTIDGLHITEENGPSISKIQSYIMIVADMYIIRHSRDIWIEYTRALMFCVETGRKPSEVRETGRQYLGKKYNVSPSGVSYIIEHGAKRLKRIILINEGD